MCRISAAPIPNSGQKSQKPNPVSTQTNVRIAPTTHDSAACTDSARHCRGPLHRPPDRVLDGDRDREPEPDPDRPEITDTGREPDHDHQEDDEARDAQLRRLNGAPIDLALRLVHEFMSPCKQPSRSTRPVDRSRALASVLGLSPPLASLPARCARTAQSKYRPGEAVIWTDGACCGNPGPGGWAAIVIPEEGAEPIELSGGEKLTTNNRMELSAALEGLEPARRQQGRRSSPTAS